MQMDLCSNMHDRAMSCHWMTHVESYGENVLNAKILAKHKTTMVAFFHHFMLNEHCTD
jgi:hypothetical protein